MLKDALCGRKWSQPTAKQAWPEAKGLDQGQSLEKNHTERKGDAWKIYHLLIEKNLTIGNKGMLVNYINKSCAPIAKGELLMDWKNT